MDPFQHLPTEARNPASERLDELASAEIVELMNREDATIPAAVAATKDAMAKAIDALAERFRRGGRLVYCGAGTSGRLGVLDAAECPPTFQTDPSQVVGLIAGGRSAMFVAVEGAEDSPELGERDLAALNLAPDDAVCGIAASGRTPYVLGALAYARRIGALTIGVACNPGSELAAAVEIAIVPVVGPEILSGSTRLKAGTATKLVLNTLTTGAMIRLGKTFGNLMVDLKASNAKLKVRANRIVRTIAKLDEPTAAELLLRSNGEVKTAIVASLGGCSPETARAKLKDCGGRIQPALAALGKSPERAVESPRSDLVIGIDGGGTRTLALLARRDTGEVIGRGRAGASNLRAVGAEAGLRALEESIGRAFAEAGVPRAKVASICLGLAGVDRPGEPEVVRSWVARAGIAGKALATNDATLLLAAGTPEGWGLAVIAGTGSIAYVRKPDGTVGRAGGWGGLLGDEGSAYSIALRAMRAACRSHDGVGPSTKLTDALVRRMNLSGPTDFIPAVAGGAWDRTAIAGLAPLVLELAADGDGVAAGIVRTEAEELARTAARAAVANGLPATLPVALAGGVFTGSESYRERFLAELSRLGIEARPVRMVAEPAQGAVALACRHASAD
jgi:N-acetylmuramic acid 6-phosphate etherase